MSGATSGNNSSFERCTRISLRSSGLHSLWKERLFWHFPDAVQHAVVHRWSGIVTVSAHPELGACEDPGSAAHHFVLRCAREMSRNASIGEQCEAKHAHGRLTAYVTVARKAVRFCPPPLLNPRIRNQGRQCGQSGYQPSSIFYKMTLCKLCSDRLDKQSIHKQKETCSADIGTGEQSIDERKRQCSYQTHRPRTSSVRLRSPHRIPLEACH